jgi:cysteine desulfurase
MLKFPIFMDAQSTTPVDPRVVEAMIPYFTEKFGHPASRNHLVRLGGRERRRPRPRADSRDHRRARPQGAGLHLRRDGVDQPRDQGRRRDVPEKGNHIVTTAIEQRASLDVCRRLERQGFEVTQVPVRPDGLVEVDAIREALTDKTILISSCTPTTRSARSRTSPRSASSPRRRGSSSTPTRRRRRQDPDQRGGDRASISCRAPRTLIYGPKGVGALYVRRKGPRVRIAPQIDGGGHERGMRSGTLPVPLIVGFGRAAEICARSMAERARDSAKLRDACKT